MTIGAGLSASPRVRAVAAAARAPRLHAASRSRLTSLLWYAAILLFAVVFGDFAATPAHLRIALAGAALALGVALASRAGPGLLYLLVLWTAVLGTVRRVLTSTSTGQRADPLLLIAVGSIVVLVVVAAERGAFGRRSRLAQAVLLLNVLVFFEAFNPEQGSIVAGVVGLVFLLVPSTAFWIGRGLVTVRSVTVVCRLILGLSVLVGIYGLIQTFVAFPSWDERWIQNSGYASLNVGGVIRAFGSFASGQEYALYLGVGIVVWLAWGLSRRRGLLLALPVVALLGVALFYDSSRTPLVLAVFAAGLMFGVTRLRNPAVAIVGGLLAVVLLSVVVGHLGGGSSGGSQTGSGALVSHQVGGLAHPFSNQDSTLNGHVSEFGQGFSVMLHHPLGLGSSVVNIAGQEVGAVTNNTEYDPSNVAVATGVPGFLLYLVILVESFRTAVRRAGRRRDFAARAALGIIAVTMLEWTNGGLYSVAFLPWLMMGWLDRDDGNATAGAVAQQPATRAGHVPTASVAPVERALAG